MRSNQKIDMIGKKYGMMTVIREVEKNKFGQNLYECLCDCGNRKNVLGYHLRQGNIISCGCSRGKKNKKDLIGKRFGKLLVINETNIRKGKSNKIRWICKCDCGNIIDVASSCLWSGNTKSCGKCNLLINYPKLLEEWDYDKNIGIDLFSICAGTHTKYYWKCKKCNNIWLASPHLRTKKNEPTGCPLCKESRGNNYVKKILVNNNIIFEREKIFNGCKDKISLRFDFYLSNYNLCIEYQGLQHYEEVKKWYSCGIGNYEYTKKHDNIKREYCKENNINLLEIPYWYKNKVEELILEKIEEIKNAS